MEDRWVAVIGNKCLSSALLHIKQTDYMHFCLASNYNDYT